MHHHTVCYNTGSVNLINQFIANALYTVFTGEKKGLGGVLLIFMGEGKECWMVCGGAHKACACHVVSVWNRLVKDQQYSPLAPLACSKFTQ
jgi:hypothetical protein